MSRVHTETRESVAEPTDRPVRGFVSIVVPCLNEELVVGEFVDWCWEGLRAASQQIKQRTGKDGFAFSAGNCGTPGIWFYMNFFWWSKGPGLIDRQGDRFAVSITPQQIQEGFDYYNRYLQEGHNPRGSLGICLWNAPEIVEGIDRKSVV